MFTLAFSIKMFVHYLKCKNTVMGGIQENTFQGSTAKGTLWLRVQAKC